MPCETLHRDQIVRAAIEFLDAEGIDGLSMRHLESAGESGRHGERGGVRPGRDSA